MNGNDKVIRVWIKAFACFAIDLTR